MNDGGLGFGNLPPSVAFARDGRFAMVWSARPSAQSPSSDYEIYVRKYGPDGAPLAPSQRVNTPFVGEDHSPAVVTDPLLETFTVWTQTNVGVIASTTSQLIFADDYETASTVAWSLASP